MPQEKAIEGLYNKFLAQYFNCYADEMGNRPCDNGRICDKCMGETAYSWWEKFKAAAKKER